MTIHVTPLMMASHFIVGLLHALGWVYFCYKETGKIKNDDYNWFEAIAAFSTAVFMGYAGVVLMIVFGVMALVITLIEIVFWKIQDIVKAIKWPSLAEVGLYSFFFLLFGGLLTECTAPREGANCQDGSHSSATGRRACSWHGGASSWDKDYWWEDDDD